MLARYTMERGKPARELPSGVRQDTRRHTRHFLRPTKELVERYLGNPTDEAWTRFETEYLELLESRFREDDARFAELAALARENDVHLGCSCPTKKNPDVYHCHTVLALRFMHAKFADLEVMFP